MLTELAAKSPAWVNVPTPCRSFRGFEECSGGRDLLLTGSDLDRLTSLVQDDLVALPGIAYARTSLVTALHFEGSSWRLDALDPKRTEVSFVAPRRCRSNAQLGPEHASSVSSAMGPTTIWVCPPKCA
jgi:hypothetical protein